MRQSELQRIEKLKTPAEMTGAHFNKSKKCSCCGELKSLLEADHVVPLISGGPDGIDNIQPLCRICNAKKGTLTIDLR